MNRSEYRDKYRDFAGYLHDFSDPSLADADDIEIARTLRADWPTSDRIRILESLVPETQRMLDGLDAEWQAFSSAVNRHFNGPKDARDWLNDIRRVWIEELAHLQSKRE
jgi:hypothetical protein